MLPSIERGVGIACVLALLAGCRPLGQGAPVPLRAGAARVDVTPAYPIRLSGYGNRRTESEGVAQPLYARALALAPEGEPPAVLITVDNVAVPGALVERVAARLSDLGVARERLCIASTHTHTGPMLAGAIPNMFGTDVPPEHQQRIERYTAEVEEALVRAAHEAVAALRPAHLELARGSVSFAANRRTAGGPTDHGLPLLAVRDAGGTPLALVANYACHCTTLGGNDNQLCGDWAGYAAEDLEAALPGCVALITIGCGADSNPEPRNGLADAQRHGRALADEALRLLAGSMRPVAGPLSASLRRIELPFDALPTVEEWRARVAQGGAVGYHAQKNLDRLARGESLPAALDYPVGTWSFGDDLVLVFLGGEVVVDYALRLAQELDAARLWVTAYANDVPCYIPSERVLAEGGYEAEGAMVYYDRPTRFARGVEQRIDDAVRAQVPARFREALGVDVSRTEGVAPRTPAEELESFRTHDDLAVELVAAEPLVESPVALDFGPDGALWVCEMRDYPLGLDGAGEPGGRIVVLEDADGDGRYERSTVFLDGLAFPTGVTVWRDGALVCASADVLYAADTDGDRRADVVRTLFSGFRADNFQARVNSLCYGLDGWGWGACGLPAGRVTSFAAPEPIDLLGLDFRCQPDTGALEPVSGVTQHGRCRDDFGQWFGCDNSTLLRHYPLDERYLARNPHVVPPRADVSVAAGADPDHLFPTSRNLARFNDLWAEGRTTSACGIGLYRDDVLGAEYAGNAFTCEPVHDLVHRLVLRDEGASFRGERAASERQSEFLAASDNWFRPVQARTGPDGALYVVDMYRFVIEHPDWIPPERLARLDVRAGAELGRIWRVVPRGRALRAVPRLDSLDAAGLVAALDTPNGTVRDLAQMMLVWRGAPAPATELRALARRSDAPAVVVQALATLDVLGALRADDLRAPLASPHAGMRRAAVRLAERWLDADDALFTRVAALLSDPEAKVRAQVACTLGESRRAEAGEALGEMLLSGEEDPYVRGAVRSSVLPQLASVLHRALAALAGDDGALAVVRELTGIAVQSGDRAAQAAVVARAAADVAERRWDEAQELLVAWLEAADARGIAGELASLPGAERLAPAFEHARALALDPEAGPAARIRATRLLGRDPAHVDADRETLAGLLGGAEAPELQRAALDALARQADPRAGAALLDAWDVLGPALRPGLLDALLSREAFARALLERLAERKDVRAAIDAGHRAVLLAHPAADVRAQAAALFETPDRDLERLIARYGGVRERAANATRGAAVFARACATCHRLEGTGTAIGPDLAALTDRSAQALLVAILDPNRAINAQFACYRARTLDGRDLTGVVASESGGSLTLRTLDGGEHELLRANLVELADTRTSLMPTGLESELPEPDMADLIAYLQALGEAPKSFPGNRPERIEPGADGVLVLSAVNARIHGDSLVFEQPFRNLGYWSSANDRAVWELSLAQAGEYEVELEYACDDGVAGNEYALESEAGSLGARVAGTGGWDRYRTVPLGRLRVPAGRSRVTLHSQAEVRGALLDLRALRFVPKKEE